jgi:hypothetical protein
MAAAFAATKIPLRIGFPVAHFRATTAAEDRSGATGTTPRTLLFIALNAQKALQPVCLGLILAAERGRNPYALRVTEMPISPENEARDIKTIMDCAYTRRIQDIATRIRGKWI